MRLDKFLAHNNFGSRSQVKKLITNKHVSVNGKIVTIVKTKIDVNNDIVEVDQEVINYQEKVYYMLNKPNGYICSHYSNLYPSVTQLFEEDRNDLIFVGRLDVDTEGLLLVTNDGIFSHNVAHDKKHVVKKYYVVLQSVFDQKYIKQFEQGIILDDEQLKPAKVTIIDDTSLYLEISEGKYHQVKRMMEFANNKVIYLKRVSIGHLDLDTTLKLGEYRELSEEEIKLFK